MLFQSPELQQSLSSTPNFDDQVIGLIRLIYALQADPVQMEEDAYNALREIIATARRLTAQLRCQRGAVYEVDASIALGDVYDDTKMTDIRFTADHDDGGSDDDGDGGGDAGDGGPPSRRRKKELLVTSVISNAIVRRSAPGSPDVDAYLSKARVTVLSPEQ